MRVPVLAVRIVTLDPVVAKDATLRSVTIDQILSGLKKTEQAVQSLAVTRKSKHESITSPIFAEFTTTASVHATKTELCHVQRNGAGWSKSTGEEVTTEHDGTIRTARAERHATFDGSIRA